MRYWLYKCNVDGGPAGYWGDWRGMVFNKKGPVEWGGDYSTRSPEVSRTLATEVNVGDVVVAYQTNLLGVVGFCTVTRIDGASGSRRLWLQPIEAVEPPFLIHAHKHGTPLEHASAVRGPVMLRELSRVEMESLVGLSGAPKRVLRGKPATGGWRPVKAPAGAFTH